MAALPIYSQSGSLAYLFAERFPYLSIHREVPRSEGEGGAQLISWVEMEGGPLSRKANPGLTLVAA